MKGITTSAELQDEVRKAVLAGETVKQVAERLNMNPSTVYGLTSPVVERRLRDALLTYLSVFGRVDDPTKIPTSVSHSYGIHRLVHVLHVLRKEGLVRARLADGSKYSIRDIELTEQGREAAMKLRAPSQNGHANGKAPVEVPAWQQMVSDHMDPLPEPPAELAHPYGAPAPAPSWPVLQSLRDRAKKRLERAGLLEQAAELADDEEDGVRLLELAEIARRASNTPIEAEYLAFATYHEDLTLPEPGDDA